MTAHEAAMVLSEIGYHLRLDAKDAYRARAFQAAAAELLVSEPDLAALHAQNALESIPGVGSGIAKVLVELLETGHSTYLARLREAAPPIQAVTLDLSRYQGDLHAHSDWSDGKVPLAAMVATARARGYSWMAVTDHSPRITVVHGLDGERLRQQRRELRAAEERFGIRVLAGIEVDILEDGSLDLPDDVLAELDVVIASPHVKLRMEPAEMTKRMLRAVEHPEVDIVGHPTGRRPGSRPGAEYDFESVFRRAAENGVALEIDCDPARMDLSPDLARLAAGLGCDFALDSDAHAPGEYAYVQLGAWMAERAGLDESRLLNWLDARDLETRLRGRRRARSRGARG
jgi:putative hydrolase